MIDKRGYTWTQQFLYRVSILSSLNLFIIELLDTIHHLTTSVLPTNIFYASVLSLSFLFIHPRQLGHYMLNNYLQYIVKKCLNNLPWSNYKLIFRSTCLFLGQVSYPMFSRHCIVIP